MKQLRIPRPTGTTLLAKRWQQTNTNEDKQSLLKHIVHSYCIQGFRLNNKSISLQQLAQNLKTAPEEIMVLMLDSSKFLTSILEPTRIEDTIKSLIATSITWTFQDRGLILNQLETVLKSQGGVYKPFISSEVNKNLKLLLESNKTLQEAYKSFFTTSSYTTNILQISNADKQSDNYLKPQEALDLITNANKDKKQKELISHQESVNISGLTVSEMDELANDHNISQGDSDSWGFGITEALPPTKKSSKALKKQGLNHTAQTPINTANPHQNFEVRRGEPEDDFDTLPESE